MKEIFVESKEQLDELEIKYNNIRCMNKNERGLDNGKILCKL